MFGNMAMLLKLVTTLLMNIPLLFPPSESIHEYILRKEDGYYTYSVVVVRK
jgi:hypothetical protein